MLYRVIVAIFLSIASALLPLTVGAEGLKGKGLYISPVRQESTVSAGRVTSNYFTIANLTKDIMTVNLSVKQFSVSDYAYEYVFSHTDKDWIKFENPQVILQPSQSMKIKYAVEIPANAAPGGNYFTVFASTKIEGSGVPATLDATMLLYLTVDGKLVRSSELQNASIPWFVYGTEIPYRFDIKDTGNVYFSAYFYGQLQGLFGKQPQVGTSHLIMPGVVRTIGGSIPTPILPGIYKATYGYKVDFASSVTTKTAYIIFIPPWSIIGLALLLIGGRWWWQKRHPKTGKVTSV